MPEPSTISADRRSSARRGWITLLLIFLVLYVLTASRGAQWQDSGIHIWRIVSGELVNPRGLALSHPLHYYLGRAAIVPGILEPSFAITLISALAAAVAVANTYGLVLTLTRRQSASLFAAMSLGLAHTMWQLATITETHTVGIALLAGELWAMLLFAKTGRARFALCMALLNGLGVANHMLSALTTPIVLAVALHGLTRHTLTKVQLLSGTLLWILGTLPYAVLVVSQWVASGDMVSTISSALFGHEYVHSVLNTSPTIRNTMITGGFVALNFPNLLIPLSAIGAVKVWKMSDNRFAHRALLVALFIHAVFAVRYDIVDQHTFFLPMYLLLCVMGGAGFATVMDLASAKSRRSFSTTAVSLLVLTPMVYAFAPTLARRLNILGDVERRKPFRDDYTYLFTPWSIAESSANRMSDHAVRIAPEQAVIIVEDGMAAPAVRYKIWRKSRDDLTVLLGEELDGLDSRSAEKTSFVLVPRDRDAPALEAPIGTWTRTGDLYMCSQD